MTKSLLILATASVLSAAAHAEDPAPAAPLTANVALTTNYKFRGQDQGSLPAKAVKPAIQGGFDWTMNGFYIGNWNSSVGWLSGNSIEMDLYAGYKGEIVKDTLSYDVGALRYQYPGAAIANTTELYGALTYGPATLKYSHTVSKDYFGWGAGVNKGRGTGYLDLSANYEVVKSLTLNGHVGYTRYASELRDTVFNAAGESLPNYYDYKVGVTYDLSSFAGAGTSIAAAYVGANKKDWYGDINKGRFILTLSKSL